MGALSRFATKPEEDVEVVLAAVFDDQVRPVEDLTR
jgi:hypothetical protein